MRLTAPVVFLALALVSCGGPPAAEAPKKLINRTKPSDETRKFPKADLVDSKVVDQELMGKAFMPGGTIANYKKAKKEYQLFLAKAGSPTEAAISLNDWRTALSEAKLVASFGGYFGNEANSKPIFVFTRGPWIAGVAGLPQEEADLVARTFAAMIPAQ